MINHEDLGVPNFQKKPSGRWPCLQGSADEVWTPMAHSMGPKDLDSAEYLSEMKKGWWDQWNTKKQQSDTDSSESSN